MKQSIKAIPIIISTAAICAVALAATSANANQFTGSMSFGSSGVTTDNSNLQLATTFAVTGAVTSSETGEYALLGVHDGISVAFTGFKFNPPVGSVDPLWTFSVGATDFSFDATSVTSQWLTTVGGGEWVISGRGMASITGFSDTPGTWTVNLSASGNQSLAFDATADAAPVPDGGGTLSLLGASLLGLAGFYRKFAA